MKVVLTKDEAKKYVSTAIVESLFPGQRMKVTSMIWKDYVDDIEIELEEDDEWKATKDMSRRQLASSPPPAPSLRPGIETPGLRPGLPAGIEAAGRDIATKLNYGYSGDVDPI